MQHKAIEADVDPDLEQAKEDLSPVAGEMRRLTKWMLELKPGSAQRAGVEHQIRDKMSIIALRAERLTMSGDSLLLILNAELDAKQRGHRNTPARPTSRTLLTALEAAKMRHQAAIEQQRNWGVEVEKEARAIAAAEEAVHVHGARGLA